MSSKLYNLFQTQVIFVRTRKRYSFTSVKFSINTIHPMYQSRHKLSLKLAFFYFKTSLLLVQVESAQWAHFPRGHSRYSSRTSLSHRTGGTVTSHSAEPYEALPEMLSVGSEAGLLKLRKKFVIVSFPYSFHYFFHFLEGIQMDGEPFFL